MLVFAKVALFIISMLSALLLIGVIMCQQTKSGGGIGAVSGGVSEQIFGTGAANVLTKITTWLAIIFLVATLLLGTVIDRKGSNKSVVESVAAEAPAAPAADAAEPATPAAPAAPATPAAPAAPAK